MNVLSFCRRDFSLIPILAGHIASAYTVDRKDIIQVDENVIYGGALVGIFGHFLTLGMKRLWFALQNNSGGGEKIVFIGGYKPFYDEFFRLMGLEKDRIIYIDKPMQFRSVTVPDQSQDYCYAFTKEFLLPYQAIKARVTPGKVKKIYLTRRGHSNIINPRKCAMACFNEEYFEDFFEAHGFKIIELEELPIEEQISLIMGADEIASTCGTLSHWVLFCKPSTTLIMLNRTKNYVSGIQCFVMEAVNFKNYYVVDGSHNFMYAVHATGACMLGSNKYWKEFVAFYFHEQIEDDEAYIYLQDAINDYVDFWCTRYFDPESLRAKTEKPRAVNSLKALCRRVLELERGESIEEERRPLLRYQTHVHVQGWSSWIKEGAYSNLLDKRFDIQAIKINFPTHKVYYSVYNAEGWSEEVANDKIAGTTGKSKSIYGMKVRLDEAGSKEFDILYRMHKFDGTWTTWAKNGEELYSDEIKLNAIQIKLKPIKTTETD